VSSRLDGSQTYIDKRICGADAFFLLLTACGPTHTAVTPLDLVRFNLESLSHDDTQCEDTS
jgi:hypothetical protein